MVLLLTNTLYFIFALRLVIVRSLDGWASYN